VTVADVASAHDGAIVALQTGRAPRSPWRVALHCGSGYPVVIASPSRLEDGTPFPTHLWLTCPALAAFAAAEESCGSSAIWRARIAEDAGLAARLGAADGALRAMRASESDDADACADSGIAGQRDASSVKCLHAHLALALGGIDDPIGAELLSAASAAGVIDRSDGARVACADQRCTRLAADAGSARRRT